MCMLRINFCHLTKATTGIYSLTAGLAPSSRCKRRPRISREQFVAFDLNFMTEIIAPQHKNRETKKGGIISA